MCSTADCGTLWSFELFEGILLAGGRRHGEMVCSMTRFLIIACIGLVVGCSRGGEQLARWTATCDACPWRTTGLVKHGVDRAEGDRCPNQDCRGRLVVRVVDKGTPAVTELIEEPVQDTSFGLERYTR